MSGAPARRISVAGVARGVVGAALVLVVAVMATPALSATPLALLYDLAPYLALAALVVCMPAAFARRRLLLALGLAAAIASAWPVARALLREIAPAATVPGTPVRLFWANLHHGFVDRAALDAALAAAKPDLTAVTELPQGEPPVGPVIASTVIAGAGAGETGRASPSDVVLAGQWQVIAINVRRLAGLALPVAAFDLRLPGEAGDAGVLRLIALHAPRPFLQAGLRDRAVDAAAALAREAPEQGRVVVVGDFNLTPWSPAFARLLEEGRLRPAALPLPTWPAALGWAGLPIDHVLVGEGIEVRSVERGPDIGSDHRPLLADLAVIAGVQLDTSASRPGSSSDAKPAAVDSR